MLAAYQQIVAGQGQNRLIADPIRYFSKVAQGIKATAPTPKQAEVVPFKVTTAMNVKPRLDPPMEAVHA